MKYHDRPPRFGPVPIWRLSGWLHRRRRFVLARLIKGLNYLFFRAILPPEAVVGTGVRLDHYGLGIVIHPNTTIGDRTRIYHFVTLGSTASIGSEDRIEIGEDCMIGAGVTVLNRSGQTLTIGRGTRIGANCVITRCIPSNSTVRAPHGEVMTREGDE